MLKFWFVPCWSGDFRLEDVDGKSSMLTIEDPTDSDRELLKPFLADAKSRGWIKRMPNVKAVGETRVKIQAVVAAAGPVLVRNVHAGEEVWTAVRHGRGTVTVVDGTGGSKLFGPDGRPVASQGGQGGDWLDRVTSPESRATSHEPRATSHEPGAGAGADPADRRPQTANPGTGTGTVRDHSLSLRESQTGTAEPEKELVTAGGGGAVAAASVRKPKRGCPAPEPARRRASEVLRTFSTESQWASWQRTGSMKLVGCTSGRTYRLYHRDEAHRKGLHHTLVEVATGVDVCAWDDRVPAEEEALALKLAVEHRERWLLSPHVTKRFT